MILSVESARQLALTFLTDGGIPEDQAEIVTDILLEAELRGRKTHGFIRLSGIKGRYQKSNRQMQDIRIAKESGHWALIDGGDNLGYLVAHYAMQVAIERAKTYGSGLVGVYNTSHCGMAGYYANMAQGEDLIGIIMADCLPRIAAWGGVESILGTNPISVAIPTDEGPIVLDMSTAAITNGDLLMAMRAGELIPEGLAFDPDGSPTVDPALALKGSVLPFGGHKGYGLALIIQILAGALVNAAIIPPPGTNYGILSIVIDPSIFMPVGDFKRRVTELVNRIKTTQRASGVKEILVPGERAWRERTQRLTAGIELDDELVSQLRVLS